MKLALLILGLSLFNSAFAQTTKVQFEKTSAGLFLKGSSCADLNEEVAALKKWKAKLGEKAAVTDCVCEKNLCSINVTKIVPNIVSERQGTCPKTNGPNCYNGVLVANKISSQLRQSDTAEMTYWMDSPLCQERKPGEKTQPGDIIAIRNKYTELHAYTHITENLAFHKGGSNQENPYTLISPDSIYENFDVEKECRNLYKQPSNPECHKWSNIFSCISFDEYIKKNPFRTREQNETWKSLEQLECSVSSLAFKSMITEEFFALTKTSLRVIEALAEKRLKSAKTEKDKFIWKGILLKTKGALNSAGFSEFDHLMNRSGR